MSHWWEWLGMTFGWLPVWNRKLGHVTYCLVFWCKGLLEILIGRSPWHNVSILSLLRPPYTNFGRGQKQWISPFLRGWVQMRTIQPWNMISHDSYLWVIKRVWLIFRGWDTFKQAIRIWGTVCLDAKIKKNTPWLHKAGKMDDLQRGLSLLRNWRSRWYFWSRNYAVAKLDAVKGNTKDRHDDALVLKNA